MSGAGALGINAKSSDRGQGGEAGIAAAAGRRRRFELLRVVQRLMYAPGADPDRQERVCYCHTRRKAPTVEIRMAKGSGRASFRGLETCSSVWLCPVCSGRITEERRAELQRAITSWVQDHGGEVYLLTLTFPHVRADRLSELVDRLRLALRRLGASKSYRRVREETGHAGSVRALEVTWGSWHGWHPHVHMLWFGKPGQLHKLRELTGPWVECLIRAGLAERAQLNDMLSGCADGSSPALDVQNGDYAAEYVAKFGSEPSMKSKIETGETWGAARELVAGQSKIARRLSGVTPFTLLSVVAGKTELRGITPGRAAALFSEFALAFKGERQLYWSPRLRETLRMGQLFEDAELAELADKAPDMETVCTLTADDWSLVRRHEARADVLRAAELGGAAGVRDLLAELRARPQKKPPGAELESQRAPFVDSFPSWRARPHG